MDSGRLARLLDWISGLVAVAALAALVADFGLPPGSRPATFAVLEAAAAVVFAIDVLLRIPFARARRRTWEVVVTLGVLVVGGGMLLAGRADGLGLLIRAYVLAGTAQRMFTGAIALARAAGRPSWVLLGSFAALIGAGTGLLLLPECRAEGASPWSTSDAVFTATSAACVTGLTVRDTGSELSFKGQLVVLGLIQVGGLGIVTLALCVMTLQSRDQPLGQMTLARDLVGTEALGGLGRLLKAMVLITLGLEALGATALRLSGETAWSSVFHAVSAFCNAGFGLSPDSLTSRRGSWAVCGTIMILVVLGGLGFPVLLELANPRRGRLSLHAKLTLSVSALLVLVGAAGFLAGEAGRGRSALDGLFQSVSARTAGFNTVEVSGLAMPTLILMMALMAAGGSPVSTAGGVKTSTLATLALALRSILRNRGSVEAFGRTLPPASVNAAVAVALLYVFAVFATTGLLAAAQPGAALSDLLFESVSALSTVGLSTGLTTRLDESGRAVVCAAMIVGRVGPLAVLWAVLRRPAALRYQYPEEPVIIS